MKKTNYIILIITLLLTIGCSGVKQLQTTNHQAQTIDSVIVKEVVRDTTIVVKPDSSMLQALIECDSLGKAHIKELRKYQAGDRLKPPTVIIRDNILTATANTDSLTFKIQWLERELVHYKVKSYIKEYLEPVKVDHLTWWQTLWVCIGQIATFLAALLIIYKLLKHYVKK